MPCNSDYLSASSKEKLFSRIACLLDELDGKPLDKDHWQGYHPAVYNKQIDSDVMVSELCSRLQSVKVEEYSLEMQIWWRDHQRADKERLEHELDRKKEQSERKAALEKLTDYEKKLLNL